MVDVIEIIDVWQRVILNIDLWELLKVRLVCRELKKLIYQYGENIISAANINDMRK